MRRDGLLPHIAIIAIALMILTGCTRNESAASAATLTSAKPEHRTPALDACSLVSRNDIESIFGTLKKDPESETGLRRERECRYQNTDGQWLKASLYSADRWELEKGIVSEMHPASIAGLGDEAFWVKQGTDNVIYVRKDERILEVSCSCGLQKAQAIATKAVTKI